MADDLDAVIMSAMSDAGLSEGSSDGATDPGVADGDGLSAGDTSFTDLSAEGGADEGANAGAENDGTPLGQSAAPDAAAGTAGVTKSPEDEAWDKELAEMGIAPPKPGQRDNRIPYSRISKIVKNAKTKWSESLTKDHQAKLKEYEDQKTNWDSAEQLAANDPERYIGLLATLYPQQYKKFLNRETPVKETQQPVKADQDPEPEFDVKYQDGSLGYSPEQYAKVREWDRRKAARDARDEAMAAVMEQFGPIKEAYENVQQEHQKVTKVRGHIDELREQWGADLIDNADVQKEIVAYIDASPKASLKSAAREVVMKRLQADRNTMRAEIHAELTKAPKAAQKTPQAPVKGGSSNSESIDDIIRNAARGIDAGR